MKRILTLLAALVALTGCRIEEAEYFNPADNGRYLFEIVNKSLSNKAARIARVMLFDLYYSAPEEERETMHDRYFYTSRIIGSDNEWHIIDSDSELVIYTDGQSLSADGATWRYAYTSQSYSEEEMPRIVCSRKEESETPVYSLLPNDREALMFTVFYTSWPQKNGARLYGCKLQFEGQGEVSVNKNRYGFENVAYEIVDPLQFVSTRSLGFTAGTLNLRTEIENDELDFQVKYTDSEDPSVWIRCGKYEKMYWY